MFYGISTIVGYLMSNHLSLSLSIYIYIYIYKLDKYDLVGLGSLEYQPL